MDPTIEQRCIVISGGAARHGKQDLNYFEGVSWQTAGSKGLCMQVVTIPPQGRAKPHLHRSHESAVYVVSGEAGMWYGDGLREHVWMKAGDFAYIPANVPHLPYNPSTTTACTGIVARTDPNDQENVTILEIPDPGIAER
jgi:uncharacterized RmlC-like cupin family protein